MEKLKNIKIAFIDIDGTLTNSKEIISNETIKSLKKAKEKGIDIVLCSGRANKYVCDFSKKLFDSRYAISSNGAEIYEFNSNLDIYKNNIDFEIIKDIWQYSNNNSIGCILNTKDIRYCNSFLKNITDPNKSQIKDIDILKDKDIYQIVIDNNDYKKMLEFKKYIDGNGKINVINIAKEFSNKELGKNYFFDIVNLKTSKGEAIKFLLKHLNLEKENAICFGDSINDYEMFLECKIKVAMGNAMYELKEKSDYITLSNDENGISYFFEKYII